MKATYVEQELAVDRFRRLVASDVGQVQLQLSICHRCFVEVSCVELLVAGHVHHGQIPVGDQLLLTTQRLPHEVHGALVIRRQMELTFYTQDDIQVFLGLDEVSQVRSHHLGHVRPNVGLRPYGRFYSGALVVRCLDVRVSVGDEVGLVDRRGLAVEKQLQVLDAVFCLVHC